MNDLEEQILDDERNETNRLMSRLRFPKMEHPNDQLPHPHAVDEEAK